MSVLPRELARRIDRLARAAHAFHRFAHHPLCGRYQGELLQLGRRMRLCRGCALAALGLPLGAAFGLAWPALGLAALALAWVAFGAGFFRRPGKLATRLVPAAGLAAATASGAVAAPWLAAVALATGALFWLLYRRRGPNRAPCESCPERRTVEVCSGFQPILRREEAFRRLSARWIASARAP